MQQSEERESILDKADSSRSDVRLAKRDDDDDVTAVAATGNSLTGTPAGGIRSRSSKGKDAVPAAREKSSRKVKRN